ncbi:MAG: prenyltransferase/squalene oxidase repeat-containing protein [Chthoniobacter sp.]|uniref:prenyltransferase/squalene oxidase repeat-containing protein n=1 Tax=Chthoniobacter sp. TaxID=2510640 RepID=UPI0032ADB8BA
MKNLLLCLALFLSSTLFAAEPPPRKEANLSVRNEVLLAIDKGLAWLKQQQKEDGSIANPENGDPSAEHPALTALPLIAFYREPAGKAATQYSDVLQKGYTFLRSKVQPDGGIYTTGLANYNTSVCLMALLNTGDPKDELTLARARDFIAGMQATNMTKPEVNGGIGYGTTGVSPKRAHPDLDNTVIALEALRAYKNTHPTTEIAAGKELDWQAAIEFISRCQNLPSHNKQPWASDDAANKGGFIYYPGSSNAGEQDLPNGKKALRSYGTMSYAGLLSYIYADLQPDDPRITSALDWLQKNYTLEENPGLGRAGLYYYYHLAAKGLATAKVREMPAANGKKADWAHDMALKLIELQAGNGSWVNDTARWMEKDPVLVTAYSVITLEIIYNQL